MDAHKLRVPERPPRGLIPAMRKDGRLRQHYLLYRHAWVHGKEAAEIRCTCCGAKLLRPWVRPPECSHGWYGRPYGGFSAEYLDEQIIAEYERCEQQSTGKAKNSPIRKDDWCDAEAEAVTVTDGDSMLCPQCMTVCDVRNWGAYEGEYDWALTLHRRGKAVMVVGWRVHTWYDKKPFREHVQVLPWECYTFLPGAASNRCRCQKDVHYYSGMCGTRTPADSWMGRAKAVDTWGDAGFVYLDSPHALDGTVLENAKLPEYIRALEIIKKTECSPIAYLKLYVRHHTVENLVMAGLSPLIQNYLTTYPYRKNKHLFDWRKAKPHEILKMTKPGLRMLIKHIDSINANPYIVQSYEKLMAAGMPPEEAMHTAKDESCTVLDEMLNKDAKKALRAVRYVAKQRRKAQAKKSSVGGISLHALQDYWDMATKAGVTLESDVEIWPPDLVRAHDRMMEAVKFAQQKELQAKFDAITLRCAALAYEADGLCIRVAASETELIAEGKALKHCVGGYGNSHCQGRSIFFVRETSAPDKPWYTLQVDIETGRQMQLHGYRNDADTPIPPNVKDFVNKWLNSIVKPWLQEQSKPAKRAQKKVRTKDEHADENAA